MDVLKRSFGNKVRTPPQDGFERSSNPGLSSHPSPGCLKECSGSEVNRYYQNFLFDHWICLFAAPLVNLLESSEGLCEDPVWPMAAAMNIMSKISPLVAPAHRAAFIRALRHFSAPDPASRGAGDHLFSPGVQALRPHGVEVLEA